MYGTNEAYTIERGGQCIYLSYRVNWHHPMSGTDFDDSANVPGFDQIARSVRFKD